MHAQPNVTSPVLQQVKAGELVYALSYPDDWVEVLLDGEQRGFVRADQVRSPHSFQLQLTQEAGRWYIREFAGGV